MMKPIPTFYKKFLNLLILALFVLNNAYADPGDDVSVKVFASVQETPAQITLTWEILEWKGDYKIYKRTTGPNTSWETAIATLPHNSTTYTDTDVTVGVEYEYRITRGTTGNGYIRAGIKIPVKDNFGKVIFVVDNTIAAELESELKLMEKMMVADGWQVIRRDVSRTATVPEVKDVIVAAYNQDPANTKALYLFGHIPVPYSGDLVPDGHTSSTASHKGAWPADVFYADIDGTWTDNTVNSTVAAHSAEPTRNHNIPGDGKYDQNYVPSEVELESGRVDLVNLPRMANLGTEVELLRNYIQKNFNFRYKQFDIERRALVYPGFGSMTGVPSADIYRDAPAFFGQDKLTTVAADQYLPTLEANEYLWAHGEGGGWFWGSSGVGSTEDLKTSDPKGVFYTTFGSWFGDWDTENNFLRAFLATPSYSLCNAWVGFNHSFAQDMALGYNIGRTFKLMHNNIDNSSKGYTLFYPNATFYMGSVHMQLMGDPTLRLHTVYPASNLSVNNSGELSWTASADDEVVGYYVYKADNEMGPYTRLTNDFIGSTSYTDASTESNAWYMVRAIKLETSGSGTYYNPSQGITVYANYDGTTTRTELIERDKDLFSAYPNPTTGLVNFSKEVSFRIFNMHGKEVENGKACKVDLTNQPSGIYFIESEGKSTKIIKR